MNRRLPRNILLPVSIILALVCADVLFSQERISAGQLKAMGPGDAFRTRDTVIYSIYGYRKGWLEGETVTTIAIDDSLLSARGPADEDDSDSLMSRPVGLDTIIAPDSLKETDPFLYKYYAAVKDSLCHAYVRDTLIQAGDSLDYPRLDSLYFDDSTKVAAQAFRLWYQSLSREERKAYDAQVRAERKLAERDSIDMAKEEAKARKDSVIAATPRIMDNYVFHDSLQYVRILKWQLDRRFDDICLKEKEDTSYNYRFHDYPVLREDVGAVWLGMAGTPAMYLDYNKRGSKEGVFFYDALESWSYSPSTITNYNSKTPCTELAYWGTLFSGQTKESDILHLMTTQNISPALNFTLSFDRYGGEGNIANETTANKTATASVNYLGPRYMMHAGFISNSVSRSESGGILDNSMIRDTTVAGREIDVALQKSSSKLNKKTFYLDQQYRIPLDLRSLGRKASPEDTLSAEESGTPPEEVPETLALSDSTGTDITTAFIGHSSEFSTYSRIYQDEAASTYDNLGVTKFDNRVYVRLQPWKEDSFISKLDAGLGEKILSYDKYDPEYLAPPSKYNWTSTYLYGGAGGSLYDIFQWNANADVGLVGDESGDFNVDGGMKLVFHPFRKSRKSPLTIGLNAGTSLKTPEYYASHLYTATYRWDNDFDKISTSKLSGRIDIPYWNMSLEAGINLLSGKLWYDGSGMINQNGDAMTVITARLDKNFKAGPLHLDNSVLYQHSSNEDVLPLPMIALNSRLYLQFNVVRNVLVMQTGADIWYNTSWYLPGYNPVLGVFYNQTEEKYGNCPYFDAFVNMQWKRASIFVKYENAGLGWPMDKPDYFSAHHFIRTQRVLKIGVFWPFYNQPSHEHSSEGKGAVGK